MNYAKIRHISAVTTVVALLAMSGMYVFATNLIWEKDQTVQQTLGPTVLVTNGFTLPIAAINALDQTIVPNAVTATTIIPNIQLRIKALNPASAMYGYYNVLTVSLLNQTTHANLGILNLKNPASVLTYSLISAGTYKFDYNVTWQANAEVGIVTWTLNVTIVQP